MEKLDRAKKFFIEAKQELKKVVWPSKKQTMLSTRVVVIFVVLISIFLGLVDFVLSRLVKLILS
ncbi:MAG: preprotein translocase subunit SecE [Proteobacteria bacterium]|nr:preprotein translocase subunit SecE [Pseudomonadota bacterium]